ncbi:hypothetical protein SAMN03097708_02887 [Thiohalomonas denitrificans]|uniref:Uncharacterized protein n=2 Tax=Thiohalomonas denitrificans TaxID=415747 RepID=A0A1G5QW74_9GAMM|nr:hypothetical protein SAMN03097708_02887 [Thiohalomonas denitrificans]
MFGCRLAVPAPLLAVAWFLLYVLAIGSVLVLLAWMQNAFVESSSSVTLSDAPDILDTISILTLFVLVAFFWRSALCLNSDVSRAIRKRGGSFRISGKKGAGQVLGVDIEIEFDRPFLDYWPHPRGTHKEIVCDEEVSIRVGAYNPRYMKKMSAIKFGSKCHAGENVRVCSGKNISDGYDGVWRERGKELNQLFGDGLGDWEIEIADERMEMKIKSGSWDGVAFINKIDCGVDKILATCKEYEIAHRK